MEHSHHDRKQKMPFDPSAFAKRYQTNYIATGATGDEAQASENT